MAGLYVTGFKENGVDIGSTYLERERFFDLYPDIAANITSAGLYLWGNNPSGSNGININGVTGARSTPVQTAVFGTNWKQVATSGADVVAIKKDGTLWTWGAQTVNTSLIAFSTPVQVSTGTTWMKLDNTGRHAIKTDGSLWSWGINSSGQVGDNTVINRSSPVQIGTAINWNDVAYTIASRRDGTLWSWGSNASGQVGDNTAINRSSPVQIAGTTWSKVASSGSTKMATKTDGTLWAWGSNASGQVGDSTTIDRSSPVQIAGTSWSKIALGSVAAAIRTDGTLWLWGSNTYGAIGDNSTTNKSSPTQTAAGSQSWYSVAAGGDSVAAIKKDGSLWTWGRNDLAQLGLNDTVHRSSPVQVGVGVRWRRVGIYGDALNAVGCAIQEFEDI